MSPIFYLKNLIGLLRGKPIFDLSYYREAELSRLMNLFAHIDLDNYQGMKVLEVGAGIGHIGDIFRSLGFDVTSSDGRKEYVQKMIDNGRKAVVIDLDAIDDKDLEGYDLVISFGVLYHLSKPEHFLKTCAKNVKVLFLETSVSDSEEPMIEYITEKTGWFGQDQALNTVGCRPSPSWIEQKCKEGGFSNIRDVSNQIANWQKAIFDWEAKNSKKWKMNGVNYRKMWVIEKTDNQQ